MGHDHVLNMLDGYLSSNKHNKEQKSFSISGLKRSNTVIQFP